MTVERVVVSITELNDLVGKVKDASLQEKLQKHAESMLRIVFDHCVQKNRQKMPKKTDSKKPEPVVKFPKVDAMPSLADAAARKLNDPKSVF